VKARIKLIKLTLLGQRKNYSIDFRDGFNYISGHTSTGKTSILEMIDYALGSKRHKSYIEIGNSCTDVELELLIKSEKFKIRRRLFDFNAAVIIEDWNEKKGRYLFYNRYEMDSPSNPKSLSAFLIERLGLANLTISGQAFSFRDLYKYSYIKQTEIDNENILGEKSWEKNFKRKATFEIIFNMYDKTLEVYKSTLEKKKREMEEITIKLSGIQEFLEAADLQNMEEHNKQSKELSAEIISLQDKLSVIKHDKGVNSEVSNLLRNRISVIRQEMQTVSEQKNDQQQYINKLKMLYNQYISEIEKREMAIEGYFAFNEYEFIFCPNCLKPICKVDTLEYCSLCGNEKSEDKSELILIKKEISALKRKGNELLKFTEVEDRKYDSILNIGNELKKSLLEMELELQHLYKDYVNPHIEQIELLNYEIGQKNRLIFELQRNLKMFEEVERFEQLIKDKESSIKNLKDTIKVLSESTTDKQELIKKLSMKFTSILEEFNYPKLGNSYIDEKNYLPYVRGHKYDDIGSLAGVTLITMAYYLAILIEGSLEDFCHTNLLIIDSPRKNLGAQASQDEQEEFKDEKIFNSIIKCLYDIGEKNKDKMQLIIVNNGYPDFLPKECIIAEFDSDSHSGLSQGLIDDAI
jgi:hypothetical protein